MGLKTCGCVTDYNPSTGQETYIRRCAEKLVDDAAVNLNRNPPRDGWDFWPGDYARALSKEVERLKGEDR
jgi:hypothetical protein